MLAVVKTASVRGIEIQERPEPVLERPEDVLVKVAACGICGSDLQYYLWASHVAEEVTLPRILGHEVAGTVVTVGTEVTDFRPGDRVVTESWARCGRCYQCALGQFNHCERLSRLGHTIDGGMAPYVTLPSVGLFKIPETLPFDQASMLKPLGVALHSFERARPHPGDSVAVLGPGSIGLLCAMVARAAGAGSVTLVGLRRDEARLRLAETLGIDTLYADELDAVERLKEGTGGRGVDLSIDASGGTGTLQTAIDMTRPGGKLTLIGLSPSDNIAPRDIVMKELTIYGSLTRLPGTWHRAIALLGAGHLDLEPLITHRLPIRDAEAGFAALLDGTGTKVILQPQEDE